MKGRKIIIISIIINLILIGMVYNLISKVNVNNKKQVIKEMTESEQVSGLQTQLDTLNESHEEYARNVQSYKRQIASAITDMGIDTSENADATTMASNIRNIKSNNDIKVIEVGVTGDYWSQLLFDVSSYSKLTLTSNTTTFNNTKYPGTSAYYRKDGAVLNTGNATGLITVGNSIDISDYSTIGLAFDPSRSTVCYGYTITLE